MFFDHPIHMQQGKFLIACHPFMITHGPHGALGPREESFLNDGDFLSVFLLVEKDAMLIIDKIRQMEKDGLAALG